MRASEVLACVLAVAALGCDGATRVEVSVARCSDQPTTMIVGAHVTASAPGADDLDGFTDANGVYVGLWTTGPYAPEHPKDGVDVVVEKPGYATARQHVTGVLGDRPEVCLTPAP